MQTNILKFEELGKDFQEIRQVDMFQVSSIIEPD